MLTEDPGRSEDDVLAAAVGDRTLACELAGTVDAAGVWFIGFHIGLLAQTIKHIVRGDMKQGVIFGAVIGHSSHGMLVYREGQFPV